MRALIQIGSTVLLIHLVYLWVSRHQRRAKRLSRTPPGHEQRLVELEATAAASIEWAEQAERRLRELEAERAPLYHAQ